MVSGPIERPIEYASQDRLDRGRFIERLRDTLISRSTGRSTGVVLGIVGPWGSGKSSVLNLLDAAVKEGYPGAVVVSFNPWLISGRNDLVTEFLAELLAALKAEPRAAKAFRKVISGLTRYGTMLSPAASLFLPSAGEASKAGFEALSAVFERDGSLQGMRAEILKELQQAELPILVLIDEIDRIEDSEIRAIAQLVRSVMDFPGISYVLSYDAERVIQALGAGGDPARQAERGRAYLEKIVQLQIPLPLTFTAELRALLVENLQALSEDFPYLADVGGHDRFEAMVGAMQKGAVSTPRDVKRLVGAFQAMAGMVADEIDWIDVFGFCALICRYPRIVDHIRRTPDMYVDDSFSLEESARRRPRSPGEGTGRRTGPPEGVAPGTDLDVIAPLDGDQAPSRAILCQLFPRLAGDERRATHVNALSTRRALLTILRLGALPSSETRPDITAAFSDDPDGVRETLANVARKGELAPYLELLLGTVSMPTGQAFRGFWAGAAALLERGGAEDARSGSQMRSIAATLADFLFRMVQRDPGIRFEARAVVENIARSGDVALTARWLRAHRAIHGLAATTAKVPPVWVLDRSQTIDLGRKVTQRWQADLLAGRFLARLWDMSAPGLLVDSGHWTDACRDVLLASLDEGAGLEEFLKQAFGPSPALNDTQRLALLNWTRFTARGDALERMGKDRGGDVPHLLSLALDYADRAAPRIGPRAVTTIPPEFPGSPPARPRSASS